MSNRPSFAVTAAIALFGMLAVIWCSWAVLRQFGYGIGLSRAITVAWECCVKCRGCGWYWVSFLLLHWFMWFSLLQIVQIIQWVLFFSGWFMRLHVRVAWVNHRWLFYFILHIDCRVFGFLVGGYHFQRVYGNLLLFFLLKVVQ
jgi:hypothetical protein